MHSKTILLIGSGHDLNGRRWGEQIDAGQFGLIARCNFLYGAPADVGHRTDFLFTRRASWLQKIPSTIRYSIGETVVINETLGISEEEIAATALEIGHERASCGVIAAAYLLRRGFRVSAIGFGWCNGAFAARKLYPTNEQAQGKPAEKMTGRKQDINAAYNWQREHDWLLHNVTLL